ncbi:RHS repeat-associated core domain-containing protein [Mediterraneibacter glycyrrhizinilyticus]|uniref:RHS repeat-associated core domain-containing protein n=1 Tax=Mediterraneibacter glycyrrhizinilyticus TaxID=342942 RepID=UPI003A7F352C
MGGVTTYGYDSMDWMTSYTNALGKTTEYTYDLEGNLTSRKDAAGRTEQFGYDESGKLTEYTAPSGKKISYDYDELNELIKKSYETAKGKKADDDVLYAYDAAGQRVSMTDAIGAAAYEYDALGRVTKAKDSAGQTVTYAYSESGNLQEMGYPDGTKVTYEYDLNDNLIKITDRQGVVTEYQYDALNRMVKTIRSNEIVTDVTYDALDHITKLVTSCAGCEEVLSTYEYTYNDQGYIISEKATESLAGYVYDDKHDGKHEDGKHDSEYPHGNKHNGKHDKDGKNAIRVVTTERTYEYDENWQLTKCTEKEENKGTTTYSYEYDSAGNRTAYEKVSKGETAEKYSYKYNDSNQLISKTEKTDWRPWKHVKTTYEYDEDGNLISESSGKKDTKTYEYTVENHLKAVTTSNEVLMAALYDGDGNRLFTLDYVEDGKDSQKGQALIPESAKTEKGDSPAEQLADLVPKKNQEEYYSITQYVNDINRENTEVLMELKTDGTANAAYTYGYSRNSRDTSDGASYYLYDGRGSVSGLASADGVTTNSYQYDPYGNTIFGTPVSINYYGYNGESTNTNTGYQYLRARYYNPANGNFTTEDTNTGTTENPLTRNRYGYVNNNPLNYIDPTGNSLWSRIKRGASNLFKSAKNAITSIGKKIANTASNLFNKAVNTVSNIAKTVAKGVSSLARRASGLISGAAKAVRSGLNLVQKTAKTVASAATRTVANISSMARRGYKAAKGFFSSFNSYVSYRTQQIKETIVRELCRNTGKVSTSQGKVNWNQASMKSIAGNTGVLMPTTASRITTVADAGVLVDTLANGWDDLLELLQAAGASLAGAIALPAAPGIGWAIPAVIVVVLLGPEMTAGETDEEIAEWKKQEEEEKKKEQEEELVEEGTNTDSSKEENKKLDEKTPDEIADMNRDELKENLPDNWKYEEHNGRVHIKDENGQYRIRIDPGDPKTRYRHIHIYDRRFNIHKRNVYRKNTTHFC